MDGSPLSPMPPTRPATGEGREALGILGLALVVACSRLFHLGRWSFWYDEVVTVTDAYHGVERGELHNPLGYLLLRLAVEGLGRGDELAWRLLPAVAGFLSVPVAYWALRPLADRRRAACAALVLAASSWGLYWSQNARFYALAELASLAGAGVLVRGVLRSRPLVALGGLALLALAASLHLSAALVLGALCAAHALLLFVSRRSLEAATRRLIVRSLLVAAVLALVGSPWVLSAWRTYLVSKPVPPGIAAKLGSLAHFYASFGFFVTPLLGTAFLAGAVVAWREGTASARLPVLVVIVGVLSASLASLFGRVTAQYAFCFLPWIALVACAPLGIFAQALARRAWIALLVLPALADQALYFGARHGDRPRWREAIEYVWQQRSGGDLVATMAAPIAEYYLDPARRDLRRPEIAAWMDKWRPAIAQEWIGKGRRAWILVQAENLEDWSAPDRERFETFLREECRLARRFPVPAVGRDQSIDVYFHPGS